MHLLCGAIFMTMQIQILIYRTHSGKPTAVITLPHSLYGKSYPLVSYVNISSKYLLICLKLPASWHIGMSYMVYDIIFLFPCILYISAVPTELITFLPELDHSDNCEGARQASCCIDMDIFLYLIYFILLIQFFLLFSQAF